MSVSTQPSREALRQALDRYRTSLADAPVRALLLEHSHLPGPRSNLELASRFAEEVAGRASSEAAPWWDLCVALAGMSARRAPSGDPGEFLAFCGTVGAAAIACVVEDRTGPANVLLRAAANDPRWRLREAAAMGWQRLLLGRREAALQVLRDLSERGRPLELRAVAAALAEPAVLAVPELADAALALHRQVLSRFLASRRDDGSLRTLRQALGYSLSVVTVARPDEGFAMLAELAESSSADARWIARENLRKSRLLKRFPERTAELAASLEARADG